MNDIYHYDPVDEEGNESDQAVFLRCSETMDDKFPEVIRNIVYLLRVRVGGVPKVRWWHPVSWFVRHDERVQFKVYAKGKKYVTDECWNFGMGRTAGVVTIWSVDSDSQDGNRRVRKHG